MNFEDLEAELMIDPNDLDTELVRHVNNYYQVSKNYMKALEKRDKAKKELKETEGDLQFEVRKDLEENPDVSRVTEALVEAQIKLEKEFKDATDILIRTEAEVNAWNALKIAYESRSFVLRDLSQLYVAGYFGVNPVKGITNNDRKMEEQIERYSSGKNESEGKKESSLDRAKRNSRKRLNVNG